MRVQDVMSRSVKTIAPTAGAEEAWHVMRLNRIHHLIVMSGERVVGVLSDADAGGRRGGAVRKSRTVAQLMTAPALTVDPATTISEAANLMRGRSIGSLIVVKGRRVVGIVTVSDLLEVLGRGAVRTTVTKRRPFGVPPASPAPPSA